jgi:hypothetical protein
MTLAQCPKLMENNISVTSMGVNINEFQDITSSNPEIVNLCVLNCPFEECVFITRDSKRKKKWTNYKTPKKFVKNKEIQPPLEKHPFIIEYNGSNVPYPLPKMDWDTIRLAKKKCYKCPDFCEMTGGCLLRKMPNECQK